MEIIRRALWLLTLQVHPEAWKRPFLERPCHGDTRSIEHLKPFNPRVLAIGLKSQDHAVQILTEYIFFTGQRFAQ
jgi:hypothetical protein